MANLRLDIPDELAAALQRLAAAEHKTLQQVAVERLHSLVNPGGESQAGSAAVLIQAMQQPPHLSAGDVAQLEAAMAGARLPVRPGKIFSE